jgi:hypothetical protein
MRLGGMNDALMGLGKNETLNWYTLVKENVWQIFVNDATVDGESIFPSSKIMYAEFNPGTPIITVP